MNNDSANLTLLAKQVMIEWGLKPDFSEDELKQVNQIKKTATVPEDAKDLRSLLWCSIDNDDSRDLDQLTYGEKNADNTFTMWIAIADVDALVSKDTPVDQHAQFNTTSVYTPSAIFSMLPEKLSTDLTSLNENQDRVAVVAKIQINNAGEVINSSLFRALVHNYAQLTYNAVGSWFEGKQDTPAKVKQLKNLENVLRCQNEIAQILRQQRQKKGSLTLESTDISAKITEDKHVILEIPKQNLAHKLIEEFMVAANSTMANYFREAKVPSLRRVVRIPKRWDRIVELASQLGERLPEEPDSIALDKFLVKQKQANPEGFGDLSLAVIKLLGRGEYVIENVGDRPIGHFGLALSEYTHSTAPNRRFPDLISQRQFKAHLKGDESPYSQTELQQLATHCTQQEDAATKVERHLVKSAAALLLSNQIGSTFKGIITGAGERGTWVRIFNPPVEGKIIKGTEGLDVGDKVTVKLVEVDISKGYIDFAHK